MGPEREPARADRTLIPRADDPDVGRAPFPVRLAALICC
jgi:hypothetical protein